MSKWPSTNLFISLLYHTLGDSWQKYKKVWRLEPSTLPVVSGATRFLLSRGKRWSDLPKDLQNIKDLKVFKKRLFNSKECIWEIVIDTVIVFLRFI